MKNSIKLACFIAILAIVGVFFGCEPEPESGLPALTGTVSIEGASQVGQTLTVDTSSLGGSGTISYTWSNNPNNSNTYTIKASDVGSIITVTVSRSGNSGSITSSPTDAITAHTPGLAYTLINNNTAYSVSKGTATSTVVIIPSVHNGLPVVAITDSGFTSYSNMTGVIIPNGVTGIGNYAFFQCNNLTSVLIPAGVTNIGNFAFDGCISLNTIYYGGASSANWTGIAIGSSNTSFLNANRYYYSEVFPELNINFRWRFVGGLPKIWMTLGLDFTLINNGTEYSVSNYSETDSEVVIPSVHEGKPVTRIESFYNYNIIKIAIPDSVTIIEESAFSSYEGLTSIIVDQNNTMYTSHNGALYNKSLTRLIVVPRGISGSFTIPNSVTSIGYYAFNGCWNLTSITIPSSLTSIDEYAFYYFFYGSTNLSITWDYNPALKADDFLYYSIRHLLKIVNISSAVTSIGDEAFFGCTGLTSITIPNSVTSIGSSAFFGCTGLTSITIPNSVTSIGSSAFLGCTGLTSITIPNSVTSIGSDAFAGCTGLTSITIPNSVTSIGDYAFYGCTSLTSITIPNSVTSIDLQAFNGCTNLTSVTIGTITSANFSTGAVFPGNLRDVYFATGGGAGTYTRAAGSDSWIKQ
ncbi:MAG: leucine-rich repeat domain-containing protein [Treponema sp.]|nr:leucine-rich repeat domain-containing protein [Treponema sp.]